MESTGLQIAVPSYAPKGSNEGNDSLGSGEYSLSAVDENGSTTASSERRSDTGESYTTKEVEALVNRENKAVRITRCILILLLVGATAATGYFVYVFIHDSQEQSFDTSFDSVAENIVDSLLADTSLKVG
jgi:hypothetical protein